MAIEVIVEPKYVPIPLPKTFDLENRISDKFMNKFIIFISDRSLDPPKI
jgi:hypothetical protein